MTQKQLGILALLASVFLWGPGPVITKITLWEIPPFSLAFLRGAISFFIVFVLFFPKGYFKVKKEDLKKLIFAGLLGSFFNLGFFFWGIRLTSAISAQTIFTINPILTAILASFLLKEKIKPVQFFGIIIGLAGAILIALRDFFETGQLSNGSLLGNFFIFLAAISWVGYILTSKNLSRSYSPITITSFSILVGFLAFIPLAVWENLQGISWISAVTYQGFFGVLYQGVFASVLAFLAYQTGLKLTSAFAAGVILYLNPVVTTLVAVPVLGEKITPTFLAGAVLVIAGSIIATQFEAIKNKIKNRDPR